MPTGSKNTVGIPSDCSGGIIFIFDYHGYRSWCLFQYIRLITYAYLRFTFKQLNCDDYDNCNSTITSPNNRDSDFKSEQSHNSI